MVPHEIKLKRQTFFSQLRKKLSVMKIKELKMMPTHFHILKIKNRK